MNVFKKAVIAGLVIASSFFGASNAQAASHKETHCGVQAVWTGHLTDVNKYTKIVMWFREIDPAQGLTEFCIRAKDRRKSRSAIQLDVIQVGTVDSIITVRGSNVVETLVDVNLDTNGILASATIRSNHEAWVAWNYYR